MITEKLYTDGEKLNNAVKRAAEILKSGGIVAIPTETVYGLAASAYDETAIKKVFAAKGRPQDNPLIVHISDTNMLYEVACDIPKEALFCAEKFWPGPFTMILKRTGKTAPCVSAGLDTVAVRMPSDKVANRIISESRLPLAAPSANISGRPSPTSASHVEKDLDGKIDAIVYSADCEVGVESTVVSFCCNPPRLLRPGAVTAEKLKEIIPDIVIDKAVLNEPEKNARVESPGLKYKHYAPKTEAYLVTASEDGFCDFVNGKENSAAICFSEESEKIKIPKLVYGSGDDDKTLAHGVFSALRDIDSMGLESVYVHAPKKSGVGLAVYNRLLRACGFKIINLKTVIGLTGPTGAGKSTVSEAAEKFGFKVIDCDKLARIAVEKGSSGLDAVVTAFGKDILNSDGTLNRKALAQKAFANKESTELLNSVILPHISLLAEKETEKYDRVLLDAPTLFESGIDKLCFKTVAVLSEESLRLERIMSRDGICEADAKLRISAGKPDKYYIDRADFVIYGNSDIDTLCRDFESILSEIL